MKGILLKRKALAAAWCAVLLAGMGMTAYADQPQNKKKKNEQQAQMQHDRSQNALQVGKWRKPDKIQHKRHLTAYRLHLDERLKLHKQYMAQLQREKRMAHYRYLQQYSAQMLEQQRRFRNARIRDYRNAPFFQTAFDRRYLRGGTYYETNQFGVAQLQQAIQYGYAEGFRAGTADRQDRWRADYERSVVYQDAILGYDGYTVSYDDYSFYFREGFRRGYEDGFNKRYQYGSLAGGNNVILGTILGEIIKFEMLR